MAKKLVTIGLALTAVLAVGIGLAFRSVVSAVSGSRTGASSVAAIRIDEGPGVLVTGLVKDGAAAKAGIASCGAGMAQRIGIRHALGGGPAVVESVTADSPAAAAGLKEGDEITAVDGEKLIGQAVAFAHSSMHGGPRGQRRPRRPSGRRREGVPRRVLRQRDGDARGDDAGHAVPGRAERRNAGDACDAAVRRDAR